MRLLFLLLIVSTNVLAQKVNKKDTIRWPWFVSSRTNFINRKISLYISVREEKNLRGSLMKSFRLGSRHKNIYIEQPLFEEAEIVSKKKLNDTYLPVTQKRLFAVAFV